IDLHRDQISRGRKPWNRLAVNVERLRRQIAVDPDGRARVAVWWTVLQVPIEGFVGQAADADRRIGPRNKKGARKAARAAYPSSNLAAERPLAAYIGAADLSELVDAALDQLLPGAQTLLTCTKLRQLVGGGGGKTRRQSDRGGQSANGCDT